MKNLMFAAVLALGTMTAFAQEGNATEESATDATEMTDESADGATHAADGTTRSAEESIGAVAGQDDFSEVFAEELPEPVTEAVSKNYPTASIDRAYVNGSNQYKLEVSLEDGTAGTLYADESGNWIDK